MKALIRVKRITEYATVVDITEARFKELNEGLESHDRIIRKKAEKDANRMIDTRDWQDDELYLVEEISEWKDSN